MNDIDGKRLHYIQSEVLNKIKENNNNLVENIGKQIIKNIKFIPNENKKGEDQFQSLSIFGDIVYEFNQIDDNEKKEEIKLGNIADISDEKLNKDVHIDNVNSTGGENRKNTLETIEVQNEATNRKTNANGTDDTKANLDETVLNKKCVNVIIKMQIGDAHSLEFNNGGVQFFNEILFYNDILPYFKTKVTDIDKLFPKYLYGDLSPANSINRSEDIIILENLNPQGYCLTSSRSYLSLQHIILAMKYLAKFHACSYIMKSIDPDGFFKRINQIRNTRGWISNSNHSHQTFLSRNAERGYNYLKSIPEYSNKLDNVRKFIDNIDESLIKIYEINDKTSVLCHGDFCRNNMFFKYADDIENKLKSNQNVKATIHIENISNDNVVNISRSKVCDKTVEDMITVSNLERNDNVNKSNDQSVVHANLELANKRLSNDENIDALSIETSTDNNDSSNTPLSVKFFDMATILYGSPVIDISLFLYLNTNQQLRVKHWNTIIETYYESMLEVTSKFENVVVPTYEDIINEFKFNSMMGYLSCAFFLPMMLSKVREDKRDWGKKTEEQLIEHRLKTGGEEATKAVGEILRHVIDNGFI